MNCVILKSLSLFFFFLFFSSCEFIARELVAGDHCMVCEVRMTENRWSEVPEWKEKGCGGKLASLEERCKIEAEKRGGICDCIFYME